LHLQHTLQQYARGYPPVEHILRFKSYHGPHFVGSGIFEIVFTFKV